MTAHAINDYGCVPDVDGHDCLLHGADMCCSHICESNEHALDHVGKCDDPPPPRYQACLSDVCIGCGKKIYAGDWVRAYEEGRVHADGCPGEQESEGQG